MFVYIVMPTKLIFQQIPVYIYIYIYQFHTQIPSMFLISNEHVPKPFICIRLVVLEYYALIPPRQQNSLPI